MAKQGERKKREIEDAEDGEIKRKRRRKKDNKEAETERRKKWKKVRQRLIATTAFATHNLGELMILRIQSYTVMPSTRLGYLLVIGGVGIIAWRNMLLGDSMIEWFSLALWANIVEAYKRVK